MTTTIHPWAPGVDEAPASGPVIVCPCLADIPDPHALPMAILPIHDANAWLDASDSPDVPSALRERLYFGVFVLDRLRSRDRILGRLRAKGVPGIVNLPSVSTYDGQAGRTLASLGFGSSEELAFLLSARDAGLRIGFVARPGERPDARAAARLDFIAWLDVATGCVTLAD